MYRFSIIFALFMGLNACTSPVYAPRETRAPSCAIHPADIEESLQDFDRWKTRTSGLSTALRRAVATVLQKEEEVTSPLVVGQWCYFLRALGQGAPPSLLRTEYRQDSCGTEESVLYTPTHHAGSVFGSIQGLRIEESSGRIALLIATRNVDEPFLVVIDPASGREPVIVDRGPVAGVEWLNKGNGLIYTTAVSGRATELKSVSIADRNRSRDVSIARVLERASNEEEVLTLRRDPFSTEIILTKDTPLEAREYRVTSDAVAPLEHHRQERRKSVWFPGGIATLAGSYDSGTTAIHLVTGSHTSTITPSAGETFRDIRSMGNTLEVIAWSIEGESLATYDFNGILKSRHRAPPTQSLRFKSISTGHRNGVIEESIVTPGRAFSPVTEKHVAGRIRTSIPARDGVEIPLTFIPSPHSSSEHHQRPTLVTGYGAYGSFAASRYSTLLHFISSLGFDIAIVHTRGGGELGPAWHREGRETKKRNSVNDFIDAAHAIRGGRFGVRGPVLWYGKSAGGTLVTASLLERPDLADGAVIDSAFLNVNDSLRTRRDRMPAREKSEWGFPSPIDPCVTALPLSLPPTLFLAGMGDNVVPAIHSIGFYYRLKRECASCESSLLVSPHGMHDGEIFVEDEEAVMLRIGQFVQSFLR